MIGDEADARLLHARPDGVEKAEFPERRREDALVGEALDLLEDRLAALRIQLAPLLDEEVVHVRITAPGVQAVADHVVLDAGGGVAVAARAGLKQPADLLFLPLGEERGALHRPEL